MGILDRILRAGEGKKLKALAGLVPDINALEPEIERLSPTKRCRPRPPSSASASTTARTSTTCSSRRSRSCARRPAGSIGQRHFDVQLMGGAALHFGWVAEMKTGEGKTLVVDPAGLPQRRSAARASTSSRSTTTWPGSHAEWMGRIHRWLGLSVGLVIPGYREQPAQKRADYACDITYGTNNEFGFDYLRDNMAPPLADKVQRGHNYAIVDEVDSILIDEARTPLIISGRVADAAKLYYKFASVVRSPAARRGLRGRRGEAHRRARSRPASRRSSRRSASTTSTTRCSRTWCTSCTAALKAKELYKRDKDYIIQHGEVKIVDEFTGRILEGRRWSEGIHQAVEAKEGVKIKEENQTLATITLQNYFRMYDKLAGMTGTAQTEAAELMNTYGLQVVPIPTNRPIVRVDQADLIYKSEVAKFDAVVEDIAERYEQGPAGPGRHDQRGEERVPLAPAAQARHRPRGAQRQAAHP